MSTANKYINGLKEAYFENGGKEDWLHFEKIKQGATITDISKLKKIFPDTPETLIHLLQYVDGTYGRKYGEEQIHLFFLGSDIQEYPYYLLSTTEIMESKKMTKKYFSEYIDRVYEEEVAVDEKITNNSNTTKWLHFSDCMNNGGTSSLFIDFTPSPKGKKGQIIRFLHDPDELEVIADSFDTYLENIMEDKYDFINEDTFS